MPSQSNINWKAAGDGFLPQLALERNICFPIMKWIENTSQKETIKLGLLSYFYSILSKHLMKTTTIQSNYKSKRPLIIFSGGGCLMKFQRDKIFVTNLFLYHKQKTSYLINLRLLKVIVAFLPVLEFSINIIFESNESNKQERLD